MFKLYVSLLTIISSYFVFVPILVAQNDSTCFDKLAQRVKPGKWIAILKHDGYKISGSLKSIEPIDSILAIYHYDKDSLVTSIFDISEVAQIKYKGPGKIRPAYMLLGLVGGALIGGLIGDQADKDNPEGLGIGGAFGMIFGAGGGLVVGTVAGFVVPTTRTIECK
ncbi:MAG: hypothetical protein A2142_08795 [candidate division Zixibacteria bacterium RBG_16_48_11]|nr:MAG: hypothetical protein A2142_08795 [candidate division Zixibacteria bacterium RBG_16_48_11]